MRGVSVVDGCLRVVGQERTDVVNTSHFFIINLFKVMGIDVVPELAEKGVIGVIVYVGLLVGNLEVGAESIKDINRRDRLHRSLKKWYLIKGSLKWKLQSFESNLINFYSKAIL